MFKRILVGGHIIYAPRVPLWKEPVLVRGKDKHPEVENSPVIAEVELVEVPVHGGRVPELNFDVDPILGEIRFVEWG